MTTRADRMRALYQPAYFSDVAPERQGVDRLRNEDELRQQMDQQQMQLYQQSTGFGSENQGSFWGNLFRSIGRGLFGGGPSSPPTSPGFQGPQPGLGLPMSDEQWGDRLKEAGFGQPATIGGFGTGRRPSVTQQPVQQGVSQFQRQQLMRDMEQIPRGMANLDQYGMGQLARRGMGRSNFGPMMRG